MATVTTDQLKATITFGSTRVQTRSQFKDLMVDVIDQNQFVTINSYNTTWLDQEGALVTFMSETPYSINDWEKFVTYLEDTL